MPNPPVFDPLLAAYLDNAKLAETYDHYFSDYPLFEYDCLYLESALELPRPAGDNYLVLDLGCGTGRHLELVARQGGLAVGMDLNPHMLDKARERLARQYITLAPSATAPDPARPVLLVKADIRQLPLPENLVFDAAILMFSTLGLVYSPEERQRLLRLVRSRLQPTGRLVIHAHNEKRYQNFVPRLSRPYLQELKLRAAGRLDAGDHLQRKYRGVLDLRLHYFTSEELLELVKASGYRLLDFTYLNEARTGKYHGADREENANGFLLTAEPTQPD
ncbi:MAG: class I SAM-dependent methyltransferase [Planctomycetota bacterium]|jgi:SAM-dependent methyltransferase|nr:class I SAM-dependent methyltransferase [Planctomycetota bacterium]